MDEEEEKKKKAKFVLTASEGEKMARCRVAIPRLNMNALQGVVVRSPAPAMPRKRRTKSMATFTTRIVHAPPSRRKKKSLRLRPTHPDWNRMTKYEAEASQANDLFQREMEARDEELLKRVLKNKIRRVHDSSESVSKKTDGSSAKRSSKDMTAPKDKATSGSGESSNRLSKSDESSKVKIAKTKSSSQSASKSSKLQKKISFDPSNVPSTSTLALSSPRKDAPNRTFEDESASDLLAGAGEEPAVVSFSSEDSPEPMAKSSPLPNAQKAELSVGRVSIRDYIARQHQVPMDCEDSTTEGASIPAAYRVRQDVEEGEITNESSEDEVTSDSEDDLQIVAEVKKQPPAPASGGSKASLRKRWVDRSAHSAPKAKRQTKPLPSESEESDEERLQIDEERCSPAGRDSTPLCIASPPAADRLPKDAGTSRRGRKKAAKRIESSSSSDSSPVRPSEDVEMIEEDSTPPPAPAAPAPPSRALISVRPPTSMCEDSARSEDESGAGEDGATGDAREGHDSDVDDAVEIGVHQNDLNGLWHEPEKQHNPPPANDEAAPAETLAAVDLPGDNLTEDASGRDSPAPQSAVEKAIANMPQKARIRFETLWKKRLCFSFLEMDHCRKEEQRKRALSEGREPPPVCSHAHQFSFEDVVSFFRLIRETDDDMLPPMLRTVAYSRKLQRLMGIYMQTQKWAATRIQWLEFYVMTIEALVEIKKTPDEERLLVAYLRNLCDQWHAQFNMCPMAKCELDQMRKAIDALSIAFTLAVDADPKTTVHLLWHILMFAIQKGLVLDKETYHRMLDLLYVYHKTACESIDGFITWRLYPLQYVAYLPGYDLNMKLVGFCLDRLVQLLEAAEVTELLLPIVLILPSSDLCELPKNILQKLVNRCFQPNVVAHPRALQAVDKIKSDGAKGIVWQSDLPKPVIDLRFEEELGRLIRSSSWPQVASMYYQRDRESAFQLHGFHVAFFEEIIRLETSKEVDNGFCKFLEQLRTSDLTDLESRFLMQLSATLMLHMSSLDEPMEQLPVKLNVYFEASKISTGSVWAHGALFCPTSTEPLLQKRAEQQSVILACVHMLVRRRHEARAARILIDAKDIVTKEKDKHFLFRVARECCQGLLSNPACEVKDTILGGLCIDIFNNFVHYATIGQDLTSEEIFRYNQVFNMVALRNIQLSTRNIQPSTGRISTRLMDTTFPFVNMRLSDRSDRKRALKLNPACTRGLVHLLSEEGSDHAEQMYALGVRTAVYAHQDQVVDGVIFAERTLSHFELQVVLNACLATLWDEELRSRLSNAPSAEELAQLAASVPSVTVQVMEPETWRKTELPFLDALALTKKQDALVRIEQALRDMFPGFVMERASSRCAIVITSESLLQFFGSKLEKEF